MTPRSMRRDCPRDHTPLVEETRPVLGPDVKVDICPMCKGVFLDKGEILRLTGNRPLNTFLTKYVGIDSDSQLVCPACGGIMDLEDAAGVKVDVCLSCFGLWLDAGELDQLKDADPKAFKELSPEKRAELFDAAFAKQRERQRNQAMRGLFGGLRGRR
ncbi:MAG TPA: zf-TFIIB domain-containing protein [Candidatus Thermoplasmatota archaeon]|nr:zf-TFIIB domain-containing protein [Candidatus Thermoplasmatota archaeon]